MSLRSVEAKNYLFALGICAFSRENRRRIRVVSAITSHFYTSNGPAKVFAVVGEDVHEFGRKNEKDDNKVTSGRLDYPLKVEVCAW